VPENEPDAAAPDTPAAPADDEPESAVPDAPEVAGVPEAVPDAEPELPPVDAASDSCLVGTPAAAAVAPAVETLPEPAAAADSVLASVKEPSELPEYGVPLHAPEAIPLAQKQTLRKRSPRPRRVPVRTAPPWVFMVCCFRPCVPCATCVPRLPRDESRA
jgi:hypothetical protein